MWDNTMMMMVRSVRVMQADSWMVISLLGSEICHKPSFFVVNFNLMRSGRWSCVEDCGWMDGYSDTRDSLTLTTSDRKDPSSFHPQSSIWQHASSVLACWIQEKEQHKNKYKYYYFTPSVSRLVQLPCGSLLSLGRSQKRFLYYSIFNPLHCNFL